MGLRNHFWYTHGICTFIPWVCVFGSAAARWGIGVMVSQIWRILVREEKNRQYSELIYQMSQRRKAIVMVSPRGLCSQPRMLLRCLHKPVIRLTGTISVTISAEMWQFGTNQTEVTAQQETVSTDTDRGPDSVLPMLGHQGWCYWTQMPLKQSREERLLK